jgi:hypothetical protein
MEKKKQSLLQINLTLLACAILMLLLPEHWVDSHPRPVMTADTLQLDKETSLVIDDRLALVKAHCTACHSSKLILQAHLTRDGWRQKIRWMQRTQKLWDLADSEPVVLDYLTNYYGPEDRAFDGRRLPLPKQKW